MRIDKYLKVARLTKRRETARALADAGLVKINGKAAKPSAEVKEGDEVALEMGRRFVKIKVMAIKPYANKEEAGSMYSVLIDEELRKEA